LAWKKNRGKGGFGEKKRGPHCEMRDAWVGEGVQNNYGEEQKGDQIDLFQKEEGIKRERRRKCGSSGKSELQSSGHNG